MSCNTTELQSYTQHKNIMLENVNDSFIDINGVFEDFEIISLDNKKQALLSRVGRIYIADSCFYIFDDNSIPNIVKFRMDGTYVCNIGAFGHAKGEYISLRDICVCEDGKTYALTWDKKIIEYDKNGKFQKIFRLDNKMDYNRLISSGDYFVMSSKHGDNEFDYILSFYDRSFNHICDEISNLKQDFKYYTHIKVPLLSNGKQICFFDFYRNDFFLKDMSNINQTEIYTLQSSNIYHEEEAILGKLSTDPFLDKLEDVYLSDDRLYGFGPINKILSYFEYNIKKQKTTNYIYSDIYPLRMYSHNDYYYAIFTAHQLSSYRKGLKGMSFGNSFHQALIDYKKDINPSDNFYVVRMKHKKNLEARFLTKYE